MIIRLWDQVEILYSYFISINLHSILSIPRPFMIAMHPNAPHREGHFLAQQHLFIINKFSSFLCSTLQLHKKTLVFSFLVDHFMKGKGCRANHYSVVREKPSSILQCHLKSSFKISLSWKPFAHYSLPFPTLTCSLTFMTDDFVCRERVKIIIRTTMPK